MPRRNDISTILIIGLCASVLALLIVYPPPALACQPCTIHEVNNRCSQVYRSPEGDPVSDAEIRVFGTERLEETGPGLSCLSSYKKGKVVQTAKSNKKGQFTLKELPVGEYFVVIKALRDQVVQVIHKSEGPWELSCEKPVPYGVSESGFVGNMCDVLQAKDFF